MSYLLTEKLSSTLVMYMVLKRIVKPWDQWEAYKYGIIDEKGKRLRKPKTSKERDSWDILDRFCWSIKRLCTKYLNDSVFAYLFSAAYLMKEDCVVIFNGNKNKYLTELENFTVKKQLDLYNCIQELEKNNILKESNLDIETNLIKIANKVKPFIDKYLLEDGEVVSGSSTALGDIAQFTPVFGTINRRRFRSRKFKINKRKEK